jgi:hypothetical protein
MSTVLQPVIELEKQLEAAKEKAVETLLAKRAEIDEQLVRLGTERSGGGRRKRQRDRLPFVRTQRFCVVVTLERGPVMFVQHLGLSTTASRVRADLWSIASVSGIDADSVLTAMIRLIKNAHLRK